MMNNDMTLNASAGAASCALRTSTRQCLLMTALVTFAPMSLLVLYLISLAC